MQYAIMVVGLVTVEGCFDILYLTIMKGMRQ